MSKEQVINPKWINWKKESLKMDQWGHDMIQFRLGLMDVMKEITDYWGRPFMQELVNTKEVSYAFSPGSFIYSDVVYMNLEYHFDTGYVVPEIKEELGDHYEKLKDKTCILIRAFWCHPEYRRGGYGTAAVELLQDIAVKLQDHYILACPRPIKIEFSPYFDTWRSQMNQLKDSFIEQYMEPVSEYTKEELAGVYKFWEGVGFDHRLPELKKSISGNHDPVLYFYANDWELTK